jgi:uncharacterized membrane protein
MMIIIIIISVYNQKGDLCQVGLKIKSLCFMYVYSSMHAVVLLTIFFFSYIDAKYTY